MAVEVGEGGEGGEEDVEEEKEEKETKTKQSGPGEKPSAPVACRISTSIPPVFTSLVSEGVLAFLRCRHIDIYGVHKNVKFLRHL